MQKLNDLRARIAAHSVGTILVILCILFARSCYFRPFFALFLSLIAIGALNEFYGFVKAKGYKPDTKVGMVACFLYIFAVFLSSYFPDVYLPQMVLGFTFFFLFLNHANKIKGAIITVSTSFFGLLYIAIPFSMIMKITFDVPDVDGTFWLAFLIVVTKCADMGGYFLGNSLGKHKLAPKISPKKTIEGAFGGIVGAIFGSVLLGFYRTQFMHGIPEYGLYILLGVALGIIGQLGDLAESLLKRDADAKDSGKIPGIGGILDVVDSLLFTAPFLFLFLKFYYNA